MQRRAKVELFERIRRDSRLEGLSIRGLARRHGVHRRLVREALASAVPAERKTPQRTPTALTAAHRAIVRGWLVADRAAPPKQRHTARRVWQRLVDEQGARVAESTTTGSTRSTAGPVSRGRTRRAGWRARSAGSAAGTSPRYPGRSRWPS
jgi:hypothetical protein